LGSSSCWGDLSFIDATGVAARRTGMVASGCPCREKASSGRIIPNVLLATRSATWYDSPMPLRRTDRPTDPDLLAELVLQLDADNERLRATLHSINTLHFGTRSERLVTLVEAQMTL